MFDKVMAVGLATGAVIACYNAYPLIKVLGDGGDTQGAADANFQEKYRGYAHSHLIDELYVKNKLFLVVVGMAMAAAATAANIG